MHACADRVEELAESTVEINGAHALRSALRTRQITASPSSPYPVLTAVAQLSDTPLGLAFSPIASEVPWRPSDRITDGGTQTVVCDLTESLDSRDVRVGLTLLDAHRSYPTHQHPPQELYYVISGDAWWRFGGAVDEVVVPADSLLYNHPNDLHAMRCDNQPLLALWVLWND